MDAITPSPHLILWPDLKDSKTGYPLNLEALAQLHYRLSTVLLDAAQTFLSAEVALDLPCDCWRADYLYEFAEKFANTCLVVSVASKAEDRSIDEQIAETFALGVV